jgi:hypothetical protein
LVRGSYTNVPHHMHNMLVSISDLSLTAVTTPQELPTHLILGSLIAFAGHLATPAATGIGIEQQLHTQCHVNGS